MLQLSAQTSDASSVGGTNNEQCLITKTLGGATGMTQLRLRVKNLAEFRLSESSDKALSVKYANQAKPRDRDRLKRTLSGSEHKRD